MGKISRILVILMLFALLEPALVTIRASAEDSIELVPIANKMIDDTSVYPGGYFDGQNVLIVGYQKIQGTVFGYSESMLKFDVSSLDPTRIIQSAKLEFYVNSVYRTPDERMDMQPHLNLYGSENDGWHEDGIRVNLSKDSPIVVEQEIVLGASTYSFDVKNFIVSQVDDGMATFVLSGREIPNDLLDPTETNVESAFTVFASSTAKPPRLLIKYAPASAPIVKTGTAAQIAVNSAVINAEVVSSGGEVITERGIEYRKDGGVGYIKEVDPSTDLGSYSARLTGLDPSTTYQYRTYATNSKGTSYGILQSFTTQAVTASMSADQRLTEEHLHGRKLTVTLSGTTFNTPLNVSDFTLQNAPNGLTISQVERTNATEAIVTLSFDGTDFDSDHSLGLTVVGTALASGVDLAITPPLPVIATNDPEFISLSQLEDIWEGEENGKIIVVTLQGGTFAKMLKSSNWTVYNLPPGVSMSMIERVDAKTVHITLGGNATVSYTGNNTNVVVSLKGEEYDDSVSGGALSANGIMLRVKQAPTALTGNVTNITADSATVAGEVTADGKLPITERGVEYRKNGGISYIKEVDPSTDLGSYSARLTGLDASTTYQYRAYATNSKGTSYGTLQSFTTQAVTASMSADQRLTEEHLHGRKLTVTLSGTTFNTPLNVSDFTLQNAPNGLTISQVERTNATEAIVTLSFDGTDFDSDHSLGLTVAGTALASGVDIIATPPLPINATNDLESISLSQLDDIWEGEEEGKMIIVTLEGGTFAETLNPANWAVSQLPPGVSKGSVIRHDSNTVRVTLNGNSTVSYAGDITNVTVSLTKDEYDDSTGGGALSTSGIVLKAHQAPTVMTGIATDITAKSASLVGEVTSEGTKPITERGIEYRKSGSTDSYTKLVATTSSSGTFTVQAAGLESSTTYEYRAYAINGKGKTDDRLKQFTTTALSQNAELQNIILSTGSINEPFAPNDLRYTANIGNHVHEVQVTATTADLLAAMKINGQQVVSGQPSQPVSLVVGNNDINIEVTAEDGTQKTYLITVYRKPITNGGGGGLIPSSNAELSDLAVYSGEDSILETFSTDKTAYRIETKADSIDIAFETAHQGANIFVNNEKVDGRKQIDLEDGENTIEIVVRAENGNEKTYTLTIIKTVLKNPFSDINDHWAHDYIIEAHKLGIFNGYPDDTFKPEQKLKRMHTATIFANSLHLKRGKEVPFSDVKGYDDETLAQLSAMYEAGLIRGYPDGRFGPSQPITRAQFALIVARIYENIFGSRYEPNEMAPFIDIDNYDETTQMAITLLYDFNIAQGSNGKFMPSNVVTRAQAAKMLVHLQQIVDELNKKE